MSVSIFRYVPLSIHAGIETIAAPLIMAGPLLLGLGIGIATGDAVATIFLVGVGVAQMALTASTRFSFPRGV